MFIASFNLNIGCKEKNVMKKYIFKIMELLIYFIGLYITVTISLS